LGNFCYICFIKFQQTMLNHTTFPTALLAGNSRLTITNPVTGQWIKVKMKRRKDRETGKPGNCYFLSLALLQDGDLGHRYVGAYFADSGRFKPGRDASAREVQIAEFLIRAIRNPQLLQSAEIEHCGKCFACGRTLTVPESIRSGWGPECFTRQFGDLRMRPLAEFGLLDPVG
jgi:hypothetical protein